MSRLAALFLVWTVFPAAVADCPEGDLLQGEGVRWSVSPDDVGRLGFAPEGARPSLGLALETPLTVDLGGETTVGALMLQAGADDDYLIEGSTDGTRWSRLALAGRVAGTGLRSRAIRLGRPTTVRHLRVSASGGDGSFSVSGLSAWCRPPERPPVPAAGPSRPWRSRLPAVRLALAGMGLVLFAYGLSRGRRSPSRTFLRLRDVSLATLGLLAGLAWWNFGAFHPGGYVHAWEQFHYFLGAKYFEELGYTRLYACVTVADHEEGLDSRIDTRRVRDMRTNRVGPAAPIAADPEACKTHFDEARWKAFRADVAWFRGRLGPERWERVFLDHGYNAPPAWGLVGGLLTRHLRAGDGTILALASIDPLLLIVMWVTVSWAFGWRATCVALLWWGTNDLATFAWTGGGLLRQDWLALTVIGLCLVRRGYAASGGFALGYATLLRIFPGLLVVALVLQILVRWVRERRLVLAREQARFFVGALVGVALLLPLSAYSAGGVAAWRDFVDNARANTRATGVNMVGMMSALCWDPDLRQAGFEGTTPESTDDERREAKRALFARRRPVFWILLAAFLALLARAVEGERSWVVLILGIGLVPVGVFVAGYYYSILLAYGLLWQRRGDIVGLLLCALSVATHVGSLVWPAPIQMDSRFAWNSVAVLVAVVALTLAVFRSQARPPAGETAPSVPALSTR